MSAILMFKFGDAVMLKSGGPVMLVIAIIGDFVQCDWLDDDCKNCTADFNWRALKMVRAAPDRLKL